MLLKAFILAATFALIAMLVLWVDGWRKRRRRRTSRVLRGSEYAERSANWRSYLQTNTNGPATSQAEESEPDRQ